MQDKVPLGVRHHRTVLAYHPAYEPYLCRLGLYQVATMTRINLDPAGLIHGLVERWRPKTHFQPASRGDDSDSAGRELLVGSADPWDPRRWCV